MPTDFEADEEKIRKKLAQLPDDTLGILLLHSGRFGYYVSILPRDMPAHKCILCVGCIGSVAELFCPLGFEHRNEVERIAKCLSLQVVHAC